MTEVLHIKKWNCPLLAKSDCFPIRLVQSGQHVLAWSPGQKNLLANLYLLAEFVTGSREGNDGRTRSVDTYCC